MRLALYIFFNLSILCISAQGFRTKYYAPQAAHNIAKDIFEISQGNYIAAGFCIDTSAGYGRTHIVMMGLDSQGNIQWVKKHHGGSIEYTDNGFITRAFYKQGNFIYYAGCVHDSDGGNGRQFGVLLKYNLNGDTLWRKIYRDSDPLEDIIPQIVTGSVDGGFLMTGFFQHWGNNSSPCLILKTDANGKELWRKKINKISPNVADGKAIIQDSATKKIVIAGYQYIGPSELYDHILILDSLGVKKYQGHFYNSGGGDIRDMVQTKDKKFVITGTKRYRHAIEMDVVTKSFAIKFDINSPSTMIWKQDTTTILHSGDFFGAVNALSNGDIVLGGFTDSLIGTTAPNYTQTNTYQRITVMDSTGAIKKNSYYNYYPTASGIQSYYNMTSLNVCSDGGYVGAIGSFKFQGTNAFFVVRYDNTGCDSTLAYCSYINSVGIDELIYQSQNIKVYPNPVSDKLFIDTENNDTELFLMDISGKELKHEILAADHIFNASSLLPGMYFLRINNKETITTIKIVKQQ